MLERLAEAELEAFELQRSLDRLTSLIHSAGRTGDLNLMRLTYELLRDESREMNRQSNLLNNKLIDMLKEGKMKRVSVFASVLVLLLLMFVVGFTVAQDVPLAPTNTALVEATAIVATEEAPIAVTEAPPVVVNIEQQPVTSGLDSRDVMILALLLSNGVLIAVIVRDKNNNKELIPPSVVFALFGTLKDIATRTATTLDDTLLGGFEDVAKRLLNAPPPAPASPIPTIPDPDPFKPQYPVDADPGSLG